MIKLEQVKRTHPILINNMQNHYSNPKGFVGRNICYLIIYQDTIYGTIVGGSSTLHLAGRDEFFNISKENKKDKLLTIVNNIFFHIQGPYPIRNFSQTALKIFRKQIEIDWFIKYNNEVMGFESLVELPRSGEIYKRDGWHEVGITKGFTCKRGSGKGTDNWGGKRIWDTKNLRPKRIFVRDAY